MKRIAIILVTIMLSLGASARSIHYFTYSQASRTVSLLNSQREIMIYCGYDYEIETYVLVNEFWMERINSAYYEVWVYGYDAYTGDEIFMPLDLQCVWLYNGNHIYSAAQALRFHAPVHTPSIRWYVPSYHTFTPRPHPITYSRSYHYDIHRHGWMPPAHGYAHGNPPLPPYYMRTPQTPAPAPMSAWTPGNDKPRVESRPIQGNAPASNVTSNPRSNGGASNATSNPRSNGGASNANTSSPRSGNNNAATNSSSPRSSNNNASANSSSPRSNTSTATKPTRGNTESRTGKATNSSSDKATDSDKNSSPRSSAKSSKSSDEGKTSSPRTSGKNNAGQSSSPRSGSSRK